ncbi:MAG: DUF3054 domain-containing protein [Acidimicrobiales bacterium]
MRKVAVVAVVADLVAVLAFVAIGRQAHGHDLSVAGMAKTSWPFLSGLAAGWLGIVAYRWGGRRDGTSLAAGAAVCISTVTLGMVLRLVAGQGSAFAFVLVSLGFLGAAMFGWRLVYRYTRSGPLARYGSRAR